MSLISLTFPTSSGPAGACRVGKMTERNYLTVLRVELQKLVDWHAPVHSPIYLLSFMFKTNTISHLLTLPTPHPGADCSRQREGRDSKGAGQLGGLPWRCDILPVWLGRASSALAALSGSFHILLNKVQHPE